MINVPIYRAKKIDSDEYVSGWYYHTVAYDTHKIAPLGKDYKEVRVDQSTLQISFDGDTWNSIEEVKTVVETARWMEDIE